MTITRVQRNVHVMNFTEKRDLLLISDVHFDNPKCDRELLKSHLDEAVKRNAVILLNGDTLCLMQGKYDPRGSKKDVLPQYNTGNYLDLVIEDTVDFFRPYAKHIAVIGYGNHETGIIKRLETDPLQRVIDLLNYQTGSNIQAGGYGGWVVFKFEVHGSRNSYKIKYFHGSGGGGVVTKGVIQNQRLIAMTEGADCLWMGHVHELYHHVDVVETLDQSYGTKLREVTQIRTASYKEEYADGNGGWHIERGAPPKPLGGYWLELDPVVITDREKSKKYLKIHARATKTDSK